MKHTEKNGCKKQTTSKNRIIEEKVTHSRGTAAEKRSHVPPVLQGKITAGKS